jgi:hypothetical protein
MAARRLILLVAIFAVLAVALTAAYLQRDVPATLATWPSLPYQSEDEFIVSQTAIAVVDMAQFAKTSVPEPLSRLVVSGVRTDPAQRVVRFRVGSRDVTVNLSTHVWDPGAYVEIARSAGAETAPRELKSDDGVAAALLDFKVESFQVQNDTISIALHNDYRNPENHEAAALLLAAFGFREASRNFYDPRLVLCRATAHLAVARAMRGAVSEASPSGQLADIVMQVVAGRTGPAMAQLDAFEKRNLAAALQAWARALRRRATLDWRMPPDEGSSLLERLQHVRALSRMLGVSRSLDYLEKHTPEDVPDWGWITTDTPASVESGNALLDATISQTITEAMRVLGIARGDSPAKVDALLSREPAVSSLDRSGAGGIRVIDDGMWSAFYQRELAHIAEEGYVFYRRTIGNPEAAAGFEKEVDWLLGRQPLWPFVQRLRVQADLSDVRPATRAQVAADYRAAMTSVLALLEERPQTVPYLAWLSAAAVPPGVAPIAVPHTTLWFRTIFPTGTAFESRRMNVQKIVPSDFIAHADAIHELSPWEPPITINWSIVRCHKIGGCTPQHERENFSAIADYNLTAMRKFAESGADPLDGLKRVCELSGGDCSKVGDWLLRHDRFSEAAVAFQEFFDRDLDRVEASGGVEWLVRYYQKTGRTRDALRVADAAALVGSFGGMKALAGFLEREGNVNDAAKVYRGMSERYDDGTRLLAFLLRRADVTGVRPTAADYRSLLERYFGGDLEHVTTNGLTGPPAKGLFVRQTNEWDDKFGIRQGDIIVAVDGVRVWTRQQEQILYARSFDAPLRYTLWRGNGYIDVQGPFRQYLQGPSALDEFPRARPPIVQ